ncbi:MAG TPA: O-antigen ligase family protein [Gemmatimonadaceae bacterium]|nr:O-antigen ligase family protein [Gemmatimonadaceae bacterium]
MLRRSGSLQAFTYLAWGLAFHSLTMAVLYGLMGLPADAVRAVAGWKELFALLLVTVIVARAASGRGPRAPFDWPDLAVGGLIATALCYAFGQRVLLFAWLPKGAELLGFRDAVFFLLLYFIGRGTPELARDDRVLRRLVYLIVFASAVSVIERIFVTPDMLALLGIASYFQEFLGVAEMTAGNEFGLPQSYWAVLGGVPFRRAGSIFLSGQGFAVPFLLFFPVALVWTFMRDRIRWWHVGALALASIGLLLTVTRMTTIVVLIQLLLFVVLVRKPEWTVVGIAAAAAMFVLALIVIPKFPTFVWETLSWQEGSSKSHMSGWTQGAFAFAERPWGWGLGTADHTAVRLGILPLTGDNLYLKYAVELGIAGVVALVGVLATIGSSANKLYRGAATLAERRMGMVMMLTMIGIAINGITGVVFNSVPMTWLAFWLAGATVTAAQQRVSAAEREPAVFGAAAPVAAMPEPA